MEELRTYILEYFETSNLSCSEFGISSAYNLMFELGDDLKLGTRKRAAQGVSRATILFEEFFAPDDEIWVITSICKSRGDLQQVPLPAEGYLEKQFSNFESLERFYFEETIEEFDEVRNEVGVIEIRDCTLAHELRFFRQTVSDINYSNIFRGIANCDAGFNPKVCADIHFINQRNHVSFYMYDDRGCIVFCHDSETLRPAYRKHNKWLNVYRREEFDRVFL